MTTVTKALDHLTDVLAGSDVTLKGTKADCIMQLADMIEDGTIVIGGGGGGATKVAFEESYDPDTSTYTLTNAAVALDALEAILTADDIMAKTLDYTVAFTQTVVDSGTACAGIAGFLVSGGGAGFQGYEVVGSDDGSSVLSFLGAGMMDDAVAFGVSFEGSMLGVVTRSDIDAETGVLTKTFE